MRLPHRTGWLASVIAVTLTTLAAVPAARALDDTPLPVQQLAAGVHVHRGQIEEWQARNAGDVANLGFVVGSRCVAVIDTGGTPAIGRRLLAAVRQATPLPVCYVINTHAHPDHVLGNAAFRAGAAGPSTRFVASVGFAASLAARERHVLNALQRDFKLTVPHDDIVYPDLPVDGTLELDLGDRVLQLSTWPTAHTDHDLSVYDRQTRTLFLSDLWFDEHLPVIDGNLRGWLRVMDALARLDVALAVPGHGEPSREWPGALATQRHYLDSLVVETRKAIKNRRTIQQAVDSIGVPAGSTWQLADVFHRRNVTAAYAELEWED